MLNNLTNFFNLITGKFTKKTADPEDVLILGVPDKRYDGGYKPVMIKVKDFGGGGPAGPVCDITMEQKAITFGPAVTVTHDFFNELPPYTPDVLIPGQLALQWDLDFVSFLNTYSPVALEWNNQYCGLPAGFLDLSDIESRPYCPWSYFVLGVNEEFVLHDPLTNTYWKFFFHYFNFKTGYSYTREQIFLPELCKLTFSDGTVLDTAKDLVTGPNVTQTINLDGTVTYYVGDSDIAYSNIAFVDVQYGNDSTAIKGIFNKPYQAVSTAISAAGIGATSSNPGVVYLRKGSYSSITMVPNVHVYCEPGVIITGSVFGSGIGAGQYSKVFGFAHFQRSFGWSIDMNSPGGRLDLEFESIDSGGFVIGSQSSIIKIKCNWARISGYNGAAYCNRITDYMDVTFNIREYFQGQYSLFFLRNGSQAPFAGKLTVNCPLMEIIPFYTTNYGNINSSILQTTPAGAGTVVINGECRISKPSPATPAFTFQNVSSGLLKVKVNGSIYGSDQHCIWTGFVGWFVDMEVNGDLISNVSPINCYLNNTNSNPGPSYITIRNSKIIGYANILGVSRYIKFMNCSFYNYADGVTYPTAPNITWQNDQLGQIKRADFYNCISQANGASSEFMEFAGTGLTEITLVGCYGNKPVGTGLVPVFSDYVQVPGLKVLNR